MKPRISVLICTYNSAYTLGRSLTSLVAQTLSRSDFEVILVDDGSTDDTQRILSLFQDNLSIRAYRNDANQGLVHSCNRGLAAANTEYVIRLDADDCFMPDALIKLLTAVENHSGDMAYSDRFEVDMASGKKTLKEVPGFNLYELIAIGVLMRKSIMDKLGGFRNLFWEEYDLFIRYLDLSGKKPVYVPEALVQYFKHELSMTANQRRVELGWVQLIEIWGIDKLRTFGTSEVMERSNSRFMK